MISKNHYFHFSFYSPLPRVGRNLFLSTLDSLILSLPHPSNKEKSTTIILTYFLVFHPPLSPCPFKDSPWTRKVGGPYWVVPGRRYLGLSRRSTFGHEGPGKASTQCSTQDHSSSTRQNMRSSGEHLAKRSIRRALGKIRNDIRGPD